MSDGLQKQLPVSRIGGLQQALGEVDVVPANHCVFNQASTAYFDFLGLFVQTQKFTRVPDREGAREPMGLFHFVELLHHLLTQLDVMEVPKEKQGFQNLAIRFERSIEHMLGRV